MTRLRERAQAITRLYWEIRGDRSERVAVAQFAITAAALDVKYEAVLGALTTVAQWDGWAAEWLAKQPRP